MIARLLKFPESGAQKSDGKFPGIEKKAAGPNSELTSQEREFLPILLEIQETPPPAYQRTLIWTLSLLVLVALTWSAVGELDVVSTAPGRFIPDGRVKVIQVTDTAIVRAIHVKEGQQVKEGDLLLELDPTLATADLTSSSLSLQQSEFDATRLSAELSGEPPHYQQSSSSNRLEFAQIELEEALRKANDATYQSKLSAAGSQESEKQAALAAAEIALRKLAILRDIAQEKETDVKALLNEHFISRVEYLKDYQDWVSADQDYAAQIHTVEQAHQAVKEAQQQVELVQREHRAAVLSDLNQNAANRPDLQGHFDKAQQLHSLKWLRAPVSGYVQSVAVTTIGGVVTPAQNLVTIVPEGTPLVVEAELSNDDIGYVQLGQMVDVKVDTFPFQKYGTLKGTVSWISPDAEQPKDPSGVPNSANTDSGDVKNEPQAPSKTALTYRMQITPQAGSIIIMNGRPVVLRPGMSVQADIITDHRKIYEFFLSPIVKYLDEGTHVR